MTTTHTPAPALATDTLPLTIHLPLPAYAALVKIAEHRHIEARELVAQLVQHAINVTCGKTPRACEVSDEQLIRINDLALAGIHADEIAHQLDLPERVVSRTIQRLRPNPRSKRARELGLTGS
ncbi:hypothetical protein ACR8AL_14205 [Clavibacter sepedonicus]|uniref:Membrane protein n=1 Tax=Clavibacter sepedonicus TaxID=31964 RepID=B0RJB2_CLASE|nr:MULTISPECIES: hypothetical protein [Clavibacter]MBD5383135.1 hypothetical protein [Clavibacter sp.]OQJ45249.1 hypothetical protein B5P19_15400 [Clavibacter sepedonicus]OQJ50885.1 hypothetical protein B5P20_15735 [Clavibacter sepedonicus]UUK67314.1 hypothetical protein LRE50_16275 [Clavibacter sepedonicus]CAQ03302.1 putative membrane protein [Clavibacter sepedonicus]